MLELFSFPSTYTPLSGGKHSTLDSYLKTTWTRVQESQDIATATVVEGFHTHMPRIFTSPIFTTRKTLYNIMSLTLLYIPFFLFFTARRRKRIIQILSNVRRYWTIGMTSRRARWGGFLFFHYSDEHQRKDSTASI